MSPYRLGLQVHSFELLRLKLTDNEAVQTHRQWVLLASSSAAHQREIFPVSDRPSAAKVYPLATGDISQLPSARPLAPSPIKRLGKLTALPLAIICSSISLTALVCALMYFTLGPKVPSLYLNSLKVSNFSISNTTLVANWDVNLTFENSDRLWAVYFDYTDCMVFYEEDFGLAGNHSLPPFKVDMMKRITLNAKLEVEDDLFSTDKVLKKIQNEWTTGMVVFNLSVRARTRFEGVPWLWWTEGGTIMYSCLDLKVEFEDPITGVGVLRGEMPRRC